MILLLEEAADACINWSRNGIDHRWYFFVRFVFPSFRLTFASMHHHIDSRFMMYYSRFTMVGEGEGFPAAALEGHRHRRRRQSPLV
jgi:hypothetical protein